MNWIDWQIRGDCSANKKLALRFALQGNPYSQRSYGKCSAKREFFGKVISQNVQVRAANDITACSQRVCL